MASAKYTKAVEAVNQLHADKSVSLQGCLSNLKGLRDEIDILIDAVESDIAKQDE